jgi:exonuclease VII small subunit
MTDRRPDVLDRLERTTGRLADANSPLDELVAAHEEALKLLAEAEAELEELRRRAAELAQTIPE